MTEVSDPKRWADAAPEAPSEIAALLRQARADLPLASQLDSLARRLQPQFMEATPASALRPGNGWKESAPRLGRILGALSLAAIAGVVTVRAVAPSGERPSAPSSVPATAPAPLKTTVLAPVPTRAAAELAAPLETTPSAVPQPSGPPSGAATGGPSAKGKGPQDRLGEAELLERARQALAGNPKRALGLARLHETRFPKGALKQEREVIAIEALRRLGREKDAEQRAGTFEKRYPDSAHRRAVETGLGK